MIITKESQIAEVVQNHPEVAQVFMNFGMGCLGCAASRFENIGQGAEVHGINIEELITALNNAIK